MPGTWRQLPQLPNSANGGTAFLLTDGSVLMQESVLGYGTRRWWKLIPDDFGSYFNGKWHPVLDSYVGRTYFASAVLADGRLLICGGEDSDASGANREDQTNRCEIYDPVANSWTEINPPTNSDGSNWAKIGDAACSLLADGTFLMGNSEDNQTAIFNPTTNAWTLTGAKNNRSSEESWVLLADGTVITANCFGNPASEKFIPANNGWMVDRSIPHAFDIVQASHETGPGVLLPDGRAFYVGATGKTVLYTPPAVANARGTWKGGDLPKSKPRNQEQGAEDGPACLLVTGNVLFGIAPVDKNKPYQLPTTFYEFDGANVKRTSDPPSSSTRPHPTYVGRMLLLPTGDVMFARQDDSSFYAYTGYGSSRDEWRPVINNCPPTIDAGATIQISGLRFNGFSQAVGYGDDSTAATNYPLVRIKNLQTYHVRYCRTFGHTTLDAAQNTITSMGVATGPSVITTNAEVPGDLDAGDSDVYVVANGIESLPFRAIVK